MSLRSSGGGDNTGRGTDYDLQVDEARAMTSDAFEFGRHMKILLNESEITVVAGEADDHMVQFHLRQTRQRVPSQTWGREADKFFGPGATDMSVAASNTGGTPTVCLTLFRGHSYGHGGKARTQSCVPNRVRLALLALAFVVCVAMAAVTVYRFVAPLSAETPPTVYAPSDGTRPDLFGPPVGRAHEIQTPGSRLKSGSQWCIVGDPPIRMEGYECVVTSGDTHPRAYGAWVKKAATERAVAEQPRPSRGNDNNDDDGDEEGVVDWGA